MEMTEHNTKKFSEEWYCFKCHKYPHILATWEENGKECKQLCCDCESCSDNGKYPFPDNWGKIIKNGVEADFTFFNVLKDAQKKYNSKIDKYGESWKTMTAIELDHRFMEEVTELRKAETMEEEYQELIDIINVLLMWATKIKP